MNLVSQSKTAPELLLELNAKIDRDLAQINQEMLASKGTQRDVAYMVGYWSALRDQKAFWNNLSFEAQG